MSKIKKTEKISDFKDNNDFELNKSIFMTAFSILYKSIV